MVPRPDVPAIFLSESSMPDPPLPFAGCPGVGSPLPRYYRRTPICRRPPRRASSPFAWWYHPLPRSLPGSGRLLCTLLSRGRPRPRNTRLRLVASLGRSGLARAGSLRSDRTEEVDDSNRAREPLVQRRHPRAPSAVAYLDTALPFSSFADSNSHLRSSHDSATVPVALRTSTSSVIDQLQG